MTTRSFDSRPDRITPQPAFEIARLHNLRHHRRVRRNRHDQMLRLIKHHRRIRQQESGRGRRDSHTKPRELARREKQIGIRHGGARVNRPARTVEGVVDEVERSLPREGILALKPITTLLASGPPRRARSRSKVR
jgi:hypothetical protein